MKSDELIAGAGKNCDLRFNRLRCEFNNHFITFVKFEQNYFQILVNPDIVHIVYLETRGFMCEWKGLNEFHKLVLVEIE